MHLKEKIVYNILQQLNPDRDALLKLISSQITDEILINIANADYGYKSEDNLIALKSIIANNIISTTKDLSYEVLSLYSYTESTLYPTPDLKALYLGRALSCIILLVAASFENDDYYHGSAMMNLDYNLIQLIESVNYLGKDFQLGLISFLAWRLSSDSLQNFFSEGDVNDIISIFTLIYLLLKTSYIIKENDLKILTECLVEGSNQRKIYYEQYPDIYESINIQFLGLFDPKFENVEEYTKWIDIAKEIPFLITYLKDQELKNELRNISVLISKNEDLYKNKN